jgi:hypothetical protein
MKAELNIKVVFLLVLILAISNIVPAQEKADVKDPVSRIKISAELKESLRQRFDLYVKYQLERDYEKQFELISPRLIASENCKKFYVLCISGKTEFIKHQKESGKWQGLIKEIILTDSQKRLDKKRNQIIFTTQLKTESGMFIYLVYLDVFLDNGEWYFSTFHTIDY